MQSGGNSVPDGEKGEWGAENPELSGDPVDDEEELSDRL